MKRVIVAISGASGVELGLKVVNQLPKHIEKHIIVSDHAKVVIEKESVKVHSNSQIYASVASGSFKCDAMVITPCSMNTLAKIACGISDNLITRAASVMIKERRTLLLAPREMPFSAIALENMQKLSTLGVIIAPPVLAYYSEQKSLEDMENFIIGKWFDLIGIENELYKRWDDE
ncbi:MAG: UbiX family flavin prenyltransferase [Campylobacterota bacterium]|nr:UbiX family flavin prenyltransferase [Campylobacterota bacterium]